MSIKKDQISKLKIFLSDSEKDLVHFQFHELLKFSKSIKQFYITFITNNEPWIYLRERRLGKRKTCWCRAVPSSELNVAHKLSSFKLNINLKALLEI